VNGYNPSEMHIVVGDHANPYNHGISHEYQAPNGYQPSSKYQIPNGYQPPNKYQYNVHVHWQLMKKKDLICNG
jgi:hypothetical protein